jgi:hypothetical protein
MTHAPTRNFSLLADVQTTFNDSVRPHYVWVDITFGTEDFDGADVLDTAHFLTVWDGYKLYPDATTLTHTEAAHGRHSIRLVFRQEPESDFPTPQRHGRLAIWRVGPSDRVPSGEQVLCASSEMRADNWLHRYWVTLVQD